MADHAMTRGPSLPRCTMNLLILAVTFILQTLHASGVNGTLDTYILASFVQPQTERTSLSHFVIDNRTSNVYVAASKYLYRLNSDLGVLHSTGTSDAECTEDSMCQDVPKFLAMSTDDVIMCRRRDGACELRNLTDISQVTNPGSTTKVVVPGESSELTSVGVVAPGPSSVNMLYVGNTLSADVTSIIFPIKRWDLGEFQHANGFLNNYNFDDGYSLSDFIIYYKAAFSYNDFVYFLMNQMDADGNYFTKLGRVCNEANMRLSAYSEITLRCNGASSPSTSYNLVQAAEVGRTGSSLRESMGLDPGSDSVLFAAFSASEPSGTSPTADSGVCVYSMEDIDDAFLHAVKDCLTDDSEETVVPYLQGAACLKVTTELSDERVEQILCQTQDTYTYANGIRDLVASAALQFSHIPTSIVSTIERHHTVVSVGTQEGNLLKIHLMNQTSGRIYETLSLGDSPILQNTHNDRDTSILIASQEKLYRLAVANCSQFSTCDDCIGGGGAEDGDPYCGWCTLEARCTRYHDCPNPDTTDYWLAYDTAQCIDITRISPSNLPLQAPQIPTDINFSVAHLPVTADTTYSCRFDDITVTTAIVGNNVTCPSPSVGQLQEIPAGRDHISVTLSLFVAEENIAVIDTDYVFFDCSRITSCSACTSSQWACNWCIYSNKCAHDSSECDAQDSVITGLNHPNVSSTKGPEFCPRLLPVVQDIYIPVALERGFQLQATNVPPLAVSFECVLHVEGREQSTPASLVNQTIIECQQKQYEYQGSSLELTAPVSVRWNSGNILDAADAINVTLYNCAFERDTCSRCLSPSLTPAVLGCGWCGDQCGVSDGAGCQGDVWIPQGSDQSCPGPVVSEITPSSGPIEGNTLLDISGSDLGLTFDDIARIEIGGFLCDHAGLRESYQIGSRVSCMTSASQTSTRSQVTVYILDSQNQEQTSGGSVYFSYKNPTIVSFSPLTGLANGGTLITLEGTSLDTGRNVAAFIGNVDCDIVSRNETSMQCRTQASVENSSGLVVMTFDGAERNSADVFTYKPNPTIMPITQLKSVASGGINITVNGQGFNSVQEPLLIATLKTDPTLTSSVACHPNGDAQMVCPSPSLPSSNQSRRRRRRSGRNRRAIEEATLNLSLDGYLMNITDSFEFFPDPVYDQFDDSQRIRTVQPNATLQISGSYLNLAVSKSDVRVLIGPKSCEVINIEEDKLFCRLPSTQPAAGDEQGNLGTDAAQDYPAVVVLHGGNLRFALGYVRYPVYSNVSILMIVIIAVIVGVAIMVVLIALAVYGRRIHQDKLKSAEGALISLEDRLKDKATEAFHDLQRDMSGLKEQLAGVGMPFVSGADYIRNMLFWGLKVQPMTHDPELPQEGVKEAMAEFSKCLNRKEFLKEFIQTLDNAKTLQQKDRVNIASLLSIILLTENQFQYLTDVMFSLMKEKIEDSDENRLKQLFRRAESILEKLIANWIALCMYKHLQNQVAYPLYVLYQAIKSQCEKGPVDAFTGASHFSLNFDYLLDEDIEFEDVTLQVVDKEHKVTEQVKVLDVDSITQAKQKILDAIYCKRQTAQQLRSNEVDLVLLNGQCGEIILRDRDDLTETNGVWVRANTIKTYRIMNGSSVAIRKKQTSTESKYTGGLTLDKKDLAYTYVPRLMDTYSPWMGEKGTHYVRLNALNDVPSVNNVRTSWEYTQIDIEPEEGRQMWHLVKDESVAVKANHKSKKHKIEHRPKLIKEVYTSRLLVTKNAVQHFLDDFLKTTFSLPEGQSSLPVHIKHLFDFFDEQAELHGGLKDNIADTWKNNSLPLRYWVNAISHPSFIFDMQQSRTADYCMNVLTHMLDNACKKNIPKYNLEASLNRILYRPELPKYIQMVEEYYQAIAGLPEVSQAQLDSASQQISKEFCSHFSQLGMLHQLYEFTKDHTDMLDDISAIIEPRDD